jgi:hypothetical protein
MVPATAFRLDAALATFERAGFERLRASGLRCAAH